MVLDASRDALLQRVWEGARIDAAEAMALCCARQWRRAGLAVELDLSGAAFGKQFKRADRSGAPWAAVIGDSEAADGVALLKDLRGEQPERRIPQQQLVAELLGVAGGRSRGA